MLGRVTEQWDVRWSELNERLRGFAAEHDREFVASFVDGEDAVVEIRRSAPTDDELARRYTVVVHAAGFRGPSSREVPVSIRNEVALDRPVADAETVLQAVGIRVWRIRSDAGTPRCHRQPAWRGRPRRTCDRGTSPGFDRVMRFPGPVPGESAGAPAAGRHRRVMLRL